MTRRQDYFAELTGVRALAAYAVFHYHWVGLLPRDLLGDALYRLSHEMYLGVNVFYVLSGFLIYYRYGQSLAAPTGAYLAQYGRNRFARIYPGYALLLTLTYLVYGFPDARTTVATYTLTQAFFPDLMYAGIPQAWTLTIEETFYFSAPLLFLVVRRWTVLAPCLLLIGAAFVLGLTPLPGNFYYGHLGHLLGRTLLGTIVCFASGIYLAQIMLRRAGRGGERRQPLFTYGGLLAALGLVWFVSTLGQSVEGSLAPGEIGRGRDHPSSWALLFIVFPALVAVVFYGLMTERSLLRTILASRLFVLLGASSYCFYLVHVGVIQQFVFDYVSEDYLTLFVLLNLVSIAVFELFEKPVDKWIRRIGGAPQTAPEPATAEPRRAWLAYALLAVTLGVVLAWPELLQRQGKEAAAEMLLAEDSLYETLEALLCLAAGAIFALLAWNGQPSGAGTAYRRIWLLGLAVMLFFMLGEELSWGQRIFDFSTPKVIAERNHQGEFSFHNLDVFQPRDEGNRLQLAWLYGLVVYLGLLPLAMRLAPPVRRWTQRLGLPVASVPVSCLFWLVLGGYIYLAAHSETLELAIDFLLLALAIETLRGPAALSPPLRSQVTRWVVWPTAALALALVATGGRAELPTVASQRMTDEAQRLLAAGQEQQAIEQYEQALRLWPRNAQAHFDLANILMRRAQPREALAHLQVVVEREPESVAVRMQLASALAAVGRAADAAAQFREALRLAPGSPEIATNLAWLLATTPDEASRDGRAAAQLAEQACEATQYRQALSMNALAAAYAEIGRFDEAVALADRARQLAVAQGQVELAERLSERRRLYASGQPVRLGQ